MRQYPTMNMILKKKTRGYIICTFLFLMVAIGSLITSIYLGSRDLPEPQPLNNAIFDDINNQWSYIDVEIMSDYFAVYEEDEVEKHRYYFVWDNEYLYIALLETSNITNELADIFEYSFTEEDIVAPKAVRITGMSEEISSDLQAIAIEQLNEWYGKDYVTDDTFDEVVGDYLINVKETPNTISEIPLVISFASVILFITFLFIVIVSKMQTNGLLKQISLDNLEMIEREIATGQATNMDNIAIYLTKYYVVDLTTHFQAYTYSDIRWLYLYRIKQYGITTSVAIKVGLSNGKIKTIGQTSRAYEQNITELMLEIANRCPEVLVDYTKENKKSFKEIKKNR